MPTTPPCLAGPDQRGWRCGLSRLTAHEPPARGDFSPRRPAASRPMGSAFRRCTTSLTADEVIEFVARQGPPYERARVRVHRRRPQVRIGQDPPQGSRLPGRVTHAARLSGRPPRPQARVTAPGHPPGGLAGGLRLLTARGGPPRARPGAAPDRQRVPLGRPRRTRWARHWTTTPSAASWPPTPRVSLPVTTWCASSAGATTRSSARRALRRWTRISRRSPPASAYLASPASPRTSGWSGSRRSKRATRSSSPERQAPSAPRSARSPS